LLFQFAHLSHRLVVFRRKLAVEPSFLFTHLQKPFFVWLYWTCVREKSVFYIVDHFVLLSSSVVSLIGFAIENSGHVVRCVFVVCVFLCDLVDNLLLSIFFNKSSEVLTSFCHLLFVQILGSP
jgi:hypothetical protein